MQGQALDAGCVILLSTCDAYARLAETTGVVLDRLWEGHPQVIAFGSRPLAGIETLALPGDPRDWTGITLAAVEALLSRGLRSCYFILEDHLPFGVCHADYLNERLPALAERLDAVNVSLGGWDQFQSADGVQMGAENLFWMRNSPRFAWKFSLHPAWWNLAALAGVLRAVRAVRPGAPVSAREFESITSGQEWKPDERWLAATYRICGDRSVHGRRWYQAAWKRRAVRRVIDGLRLSARLGGGEKLLQRLDRRLLVYLNYINGAYPIYWSGVMQRGKPHADALCWLELTGQREVRELLRPVAG